MGDFEGWMISGILEILLAQSPPNLGDLGGLPSMQPKPITFVQQPFADCVISIFNASEPQ
ncbi:hypothetical protein LEP3755_43600 [Leptolyngbya sp. NIES-3755]|nr:hypothetical protein LEP3755_43600 [Leptolyngbya sp. NIES-3755]